MNTQELIPLISDDTLHSSERLVDARSLYAFLGVDARFNDWFARRIAEYDFQQGSDFYSALSKSTGGRRGREYRITLDMAKELAMVERNDKGRQARRYFIECEKRLKSIAPDDAKDIMHQTIGTSGEMVLDQVIDQKGHQIPSTLRRSFKQTMKSRLRTRFNVQKTALIPAESLADACNFIVAYNVEGEWIPSDCDPAVTHAGFEIPSKSRVNERWLVSFDIHGNQKAERLEMEAFALTHEEIVQAIKIGEMPASTPQMFNLLFAVSENLRRRAEFRH